MRETTRYRDIEVTYQDMNMKNQKENLPAGQHRSFSMNVTIWTELLSEEKIPEYDRLKA